MSEKTINKSLAKPLVITASLLGIIQGLTWLIFSILCICCYLGALLNDNNQYYYNYIYNLFLDKDYNATNTPWDTIVTPQTFFIFMWFYLVLSVIWLSISSYLIWAMIHEKWTKIKLDLGLWSLFTILISILDLILMSLIAYDYDQFMSYEGLQPKPLVNNESTIEVCYGIVMSIAARGYILLIINLVFAGILIKFFLDLRRGLGTDDPRRSLVYGYQTPSTPWYGNVDDPWVADDILTHHTNPAFTDDTDQTKPAFERSASFFPVIPPTEQTNSYPTSYGNINYKNAPTTLDSRQSTSLNRPNHNQHLPPIKHDPNRPFIPPPDYSPPGTPTGLKSVLRSTSNY